MKVCLTLICLFFLAALQDGETVRTFYKEEGGSITVTCEFDNSGTKRFVCKQTCEGKNILIETTEDRYKRGRFGIRYEGRGITQSDFLHVSITDLKPSDSGRYRCRSDTWRGIQYDDFYLVVTKDPPEPKWTPKPFIGSTFLPTSTQSFSPSPPETIELSEKPAAAAASDLLLYVGLVLVVLIVSLAAALLIFIRRKNFSQQKGLPEETEFANFSKAKDDAVEYSELQFLKDASASAHSAPCGHAENVTYSEIQMNSANLSDDSALYSNISLQQ